MLVESCIDVSTLWEIGFAIEPCRREVLGRPVAWYSKGFFVPVYMLVESCIDVSTLWEIDIDIDLDIGIEQCRREVPGRPVAWYSNGFLFQCRCS